MGSKKKKVAIVTGSLITGGAEAMVAQLAININKYTNYNAKVICIYKSVNSPIEQLLKDNGIEVVFLDKEHGPDIRTFLKLGEVLRKVNPDIVHTHLSGAIYAYPWVFFRKCKMVHTLHTVPKNEFSKFTQKLLEFYYKIGKATLVTISPQNQKAAITHFSLDFSKVKMIFNPVDTKKYYKIAERKDDFTFINVGRHDRNKNQALIIRAIKVLKQEKPNVQLYLIGDGDQNSFLRKLVKDLNLEENIIFTGIVKDVEKYLAQSDIYVHSSHYEGLPLSILEAMAAGLPIISTDVGGVRDIVKDNGILVKDDDLEELIHAMRYLMNERETQKNMSKISYQYVQNFDSKIIAEKYCELYDEVSKNL